MRPFALTSTSDAGRAAAATLPVNAEKTAPVLARVARNTPPVDAVTNNARALGDSAKPVAPPPGVESAATATHARPAVVAGSTGTAAYTVAVFAFGAAETSTYSAPPVTEQAEG